MLEGIPLSVADMSGWGLLILLATLNVVGIFRGWVVPKPFYELAVKRGDALQTTADNQREVISTQSQTILKQTAVGDTVVRVIGSIQEARTDGGGSS